MGYSGQQFNNLRKTIHGEDSDLFDVLSNVPCHKDIVPRADWTDRARLHLDSYDSKNTKAYFLTGNLLIFTRLNASPAYSHLSPTLETAAGMASEIILAEE